MEIGGETRWSQMFKLNGKEIPVNDLPIGKRDCVFLDVGVITNQGLCMQGNPGPIVHFYGVGNGTWVICRSL